MIKNNRYDQRMAKLGSYFIDVSHEAQPFPGVLALATQVQQALTASAAAPGALGSPQYLVAFLTAWLYQDEDAHDTCSLTACLNPLHPGPCKGWKGTLHSVAPNVWKGIEEERVKKLNAKRVAKIADLKAQGKPIPKKLLTPILPKPHPGAGKTANGASGGAHDAGKAINDAAGVKPNEPGKVTLGQAAKVVKITDAQPGVKGPKGKKPTVASKGIATVIAQEKVTPQYKLDKAAGITDEQWKALSGSEQDVIRGELKKIQVDGFGPQQKKATDLLEKLERKDNAPKPAPKLKDAGQVSAPSITPAKTKQPPAVKNPATSKAQAAALIALADAIPGVKAGSMADADKLEAVVDKLKKGGKLTDQPKMKLLVDKLAQSALKQATTDKMPGLGHGDNDAHIGTFNAEIKAHIEDGKKGLPPLVEKMVKHHEAAKNGNVKTGVEDLVKNGLPKPVAAPTVTPTVSAKDVDKTPDVPAHVKHAIDMANGTAPGASWSKNHLAAYEKLTADDFSKIDKDTQQKILAELKKAETKFLDPKKIVAAKNLQAKLTAKKDEPNTPAAPKVVSFTDDMHDHSVSAADAKKAAAAQPVAALHAVAKKLSGLEPEDDPDSPALKTKAVSSANDLAEMMTKGLDAKTLNEPSLKKALDDFKAAAIEQLHATQVAKAKQSAYNKVSKTLYADGSPVVTTKLTPIEKASLQAYQKHLLDHPIKTATPDMDDLGAKTLASQKALMDEITAAKKKASAPGPENMTKTQLNDAAFPLLSDGKDKDGTSADTSLTMDEINSSKALGVEAAKQEAAKYPPNVLADPAVAAKQKAVEQAATQYMNTGVAQVKLNQHLDKYHGKALASGEDVNGNPLTAIDKKILALHKQQMLKDHQYLADLVDKQLQKLADAKKDFHAAAEKAANTPPTPVVLSDYDAKTVENAYSGAWGSVASKAVQFGVKWDHSQKMKAHPEYATLTQELGELKTAAGVLAKMHAQAQVAHQNVPLDPDTGNELTTSPEWKAWQDQIHAVQAGEKAFTVTLNKAQKRLDKIRAEAGLKKRALPKLDAPAVKASAAESAYYITANYSGPNYGKPEAAKNYLVAKLGSQLGTKHMSATEKKLAKTLGNLADSTPSSTKIKNAGTSPVNLSGGDSIDSIPADLKKQITADYKSMPKGKYLSDPAEDTFDNLVNLAAAHGKNIPGGLSVDQVMKTIDATFAKQLGVTNSGMLEKKITEWLATGVGKTYAESHSTPSASVVKQLSGELDLPDGVTLAPGEKVQKLAGPGPHDETLPSSAFKPLSATEATESQNAYLKSQKITLTPAQKSSLTSYTGSAYHTYNTYLRKGGSLSPAYKQDIINIQSAMQPLQQHTLLKRGTGWDALPAEYQGAANVQKLIGKTIEEPGFTSSTVAGESGSFGGALQLEIEAPIGTPAYFVKSLSHFKGENEMLLAAGTKFKVLSVNQSGGKTVLRVRIVGDK